MPKAIGFDQLKRMFPFAFFDELSTQLKEYVLLNPAFILPRRLANQPMTPEKRKQMFDVARDNGAARTLSEHNLLNVEPFGELLMLDVCCPADQAVIHTEEERAKVPMSILVCQLYDSSDAPVFATDVTEDSITQIPEILWDDPRLMIGIVTFKTEGASVGVLKIPESIENKVLETKPS